MGRIATVRNLGGAMNAVGNKVIPIVTRKRGNKGGSGEGGGGSGGGKSTPTDDWKSKLTHNRDYKIEGTLHNLITILVNDERLQGLFWLNDSSNQLLMSRDAPWPGSTRSEFVDADAAELAAWLQHPDRYDMKCSDDGVLKAVIAIARRNRRHPIREYLSGLKWDQKPRVESMLIDMFGAIDSTYVRQASMCFLVGAVARVLWVDPKNPALGAKVDFMLVLEGAQGKGKSTSLSELFSPQWFVETSESPTGKDFYQVIQGVWGVEIGEMDSFGKADVTAVKVAITRRTDKFRAPYERMPGSYRRECIFVGTTNDREYLRDATGGRRFLPVRADGGVDLDRIRAERDQIWAEAVSLFLSGFKYWVLPDDAAVEQAARYMADSWEDLVRAWLTGQSLLLDKHCPPRLLGSQPAPIPWTTTTEILQYAIGVEPGKHTRMDQMRVAAAMKRIGTTPLAADGHPEDAWEHQQRRWPDGSRERRWVRVSAVSAEEMEDAKQY